MGNQCMATLRGPNAARVTLEKPHTDESFQLSQSLCCRRLAHANFRGGARNTSAIFHHHK
ncbi:hypothetical protein CBM2586_A110083 [Cupriavidus phytorum]|uniref:Uncharacterized protein n=1 Tax=Cupriavidus taiwanensis TaxID=164546 RepID=A0A975X6F4_9BURK|nr:hypothetical protein CBM2586_A110083 [Cupriavidus taiwanensis]